MASHVIPARPAVTGTWNVVIIITTNNEMSRTANTLPRNVLMNTSNIWHAISSCRKSADRDVGLPKWLHNTKYGHATTSPTSQNNVSLKCPMPVYEYRLSHVRRMPPE